MLPQQVVLETNVFKKIWNSAELAKAKKVIDRYFAATADWDNSVNDMGLTYQAGEEYAALCTAGDFYLDEGVRMASFAWTHDGKLILVGIEDDDDQMVYYELEEF